jgi:hypothetical protein
MIDHLGWIFLVEHALNSNGQRHSVQHHNVQHRSDRSRSRIGERGVCTAMSWLPTLERQNKTQIRS